MNYKILNYILNNCDLDEIDVDAVAKYINEECNEDDITEYANLIIYFENTESINKLIWQKFEQK